jgi:TonB family protein
MRPEFTYHRGAVRPIQCLSGGVELLRGVYGGFLGVVIVACLVMMVGGCIPLAPLNAPILCGIYLCLLARIYNQPFNTGTLFKGFEHFGQSFIASLFVSVPMFVLGLLFQFSMGGFQVIIQNLKLDKSSRPEEVLEELLPVLLGFFSFFIIGIVVLMLVGMVLNALMIFVYPLIVEHKMKGMDAVKLGFRAVLGNFFGVFGLVLLETLLILAGVMLFYVGALFVLPVIFAARMVAYRQAFPAPVQPATPELNAGARQAWSPQMITSKAGWYLTASALIIVGLGITGAVGLGIWSYGAISEVIKQAEEKHREREFNYYPTPSPSPFKSNTNSSEQTGENLNDQTVEMPPPVYPPAARAAKAMGTVTVEVTVNEKGEVTRATALSGHPLLRAAAEQAARKAKFKPNLQNGKAAPLKGVLTYDFTAPN